MSRCIAHAPSKSRERVALGTPGSTPHSAGSRGSILDQAHSRTQPRTASHTSHSILTISTLEDASARSIQARHSKELEWQNLTSSGGEPLSAKAEVQRVIAPDARGWSTRYERWFFTHRCCTPSEQLPNVRAACMNTSKLADASIISKDGWHVVKKWGGL